MNYSNLKDQSHVFVIAEAGSNWKVGTYEKDIARATELIKTASKSGADAVKFQTFRPETVYVRNAGKSDYLKKTGFEKDVFGTFQDLSMPYEMLKELSEVCYKENVGFLSTPFSVKDAEMINKYVQIHKVASYEINHIRILEYLAKQGKPVILSTGACNYEEIDFAVNFFKNHGLDEIAILQCTASYPAPIESLNLLAIPQLQRRYNIPVGLSDHSLDPIIAPVMAVSLGATIIEKHFTLSKDLPGPDHQFALEPEELSKMIQYVRMAQEARGNGNKNILQVEEELRNFAVRSVQAIKDISIGEDFVEDENVALLRPGIQKRGAEPRFFNKILGKKSKRKIKAGEGVNIQDCLR